MPIAAAANAYHAVNSTDGSGKPQIEYHFNWRFMFLWDNYEDGIAAGEQYWKAPNRFIQIVYWSCLRNPVNNLRIVPFLSVKINPDNVKFIGKVDGLRWNLTEEDKDQHKVLIQMFDTKVPQWYYARDGLYSTFYIQFNALGHLRRFWIGWKIYPTDVYGVTPYRKHGAGFTSQLKVVK